MGCSVLGLPFFTLLLIPFEPLISLRVETFRILVIAVFIILCRHAVQCRIEVLRSRINRIVGLLEGQGNTAAVKVNINNLDKHGLTRLNNSFRILNIAVGEFGNMDKAFNTVIHGNEYAELHDLGDLAFNDLPGDMCTGKMLPRIFLGGLQGQ